MYCPRSPVWWIMKCHKHSECLIYLNLQLYTIWSTDYFCLLAIGLKLMHHIWVIFPNFQKIIEGYNSLDLVQKYTWILLHGHYLFLKGWPQVFSRHMLHVLYSQKTVCFSEQIISTDKYPSIHVFSCQMGAIVYLSI